MAKTRSQTQYSTIKKEEEYESKESQLLRGLSNKTKKSSKISKRNASRNENSLSSISQVKLEEEDINKNLLRKNASGDNQATAVTLKDKLEKLFDYVINGKMSIPAAARKAKMSCASAYKYFRIYKNDPERNIPVPVVNIGKKNGATTQDKIKKLIHYVEVEKISITAAAAKANMSDTTAYKYYKVYINDPERNIPVPLVNNRNKNGATTQEKIKRLIDYVETEKMSIPMAARKLHISELTARKYYRRYNNDPERNTPLLLLYNMHNTGPVTQDKIKKPIDYVEVEKMSITTAASKANISDTTAYKYYKAYINDPERNIPVPVVNTRDNYAPVTQDQVNKVIAYIVDDKMTINAASIKVNISASTARKYYLKYLHCPDHNMPTVKRDSTAVPKLVDKERVKALIEYIVRDKMSVEIASIKAGMDIATARKYYSLYLNDPNHQIPIPKIDISESITDSQISSLINYITNDKLSVAAAARKVKTMPYSAYYYYKRYKTKRKVPTPIRKCNLYTQEQMKKLVDYVESDKLSIRDAAEKVKMTTSTAYRYIARLRKK